MMIVTSILVFMLVQGRADEETNNRTLNKSKEEPKDLQQRKHDGVILPEVQCGLYTAIVPVEPGTGNLGIRPQFVNVTRCQGSCAHSPGIRECEPTKYRTIPVRVTSTAGEKTSIRDVQEHLECRCACLVTCNFLVQYIDENDCRCVCIKKVQKR